MNNVKKLFLGLLLPILFCDFLYSMESSNTKSSANAAASTSTTKPPRSRPSKRKRDDGSASTVTTVMPLETTVATVASAKKNSTDEKPTNKKVKRSKKVTQDKVTQDKNNKGSSTSSNSSVVPSVKMTQNLIEEMKKTFGINSPQDSILTVGKHGSCDKYSAVCKQNHGIGAMYELVCMLAGYKDIGCFFASALQKIDQRLITLLASNDCPIKILRVKLDPSNSKSPLYLYAYNKHSEEAMRNVYSLAKWHCNTMSENAYLTGKLLKYSDEDIDFYYKRPAFDKYYQTNFGASVLDTDYPLWGDAIREEFKTWEINTWQSTSDYETFRADQDEANAWMACNNSIEKLKQELSSHIVNSQIQ